MRATNRLNLTLMSLIYRIQCWQSYPQVISKLSHSRVFHCTAAVSEKENGESSASISKRKVAIVLGYVGTEFNGLQKQNDDGTRTVEGVLEKALFEAGLIRESNYGDLKKIGWGRTSRTDKGVHAAKTVIAAKLQLANVQFLPSGLHPNAKDAVNEMLPDDLKVFSICKVRKGFNGRSSCSWRDYEYYLPMSIFRNENAVERFEKVIKNFTGSHSFHNFMSMKGSELKSKWKKINESRSNSSEENNALLDDEDSDFSSSENNEKDPLFSEEGLIDSNFPVRKMMKEMRTTVHKMEAEKFDLKRSEKSTERLIKVKIRGQGFLYNQIRLMIGASLAESNSWVPEGWVRYGLRVPYTLHFPLAPAEGLLLLSQGFTRGKLGNSAVLEPDLLSEFGGDVTFWGEKNHELKVSNRLQALMSSSDLEMAEHFKVTKILPKIATSWVDDKVGEEWSKWAEERYSLAPVEDLDRFEGALRAFDNHLKELEQKDFVRKIEIRKLALEKGSKYYKDYLPKGFVNSLIVRFDLLPGNKVTAICQALVQRMKNSNDKNNKIEHFETNDEILEKVEQIGIENLAKEGKFKPGIQS